MAGRRPRILGSYAPRSWGVEHPQDWQKWGSIFDQPNNLKVDSMSMLFSHRSFQNPIAISPGFLAVFLEKRIPGRNGEVTPRNMRAFEFRSPQIFGACQGMLGLELFANQWVFRIKPLKAKLLGGEQKETENGPLPQAELLSLWQKEGRKPSMFEVSPTLRHPFTCWCSRKRGNDFYKLPGSPFTGHLGCFVPSGSGKWARLGFSGPSS